MKFKFVWLALFILVLTITVFSAKTAENTFTGYWEGENISSNNNQKYPAKIIINLLEEQPNVFYWGGDFKIPMTGRKDETKLYLTTTIQGYTFNATYTLDKMADNRLKGEIVRISPTGTVESRTGSFNRFATDQTGWGLDIDYLKKTLPKKHLDLFFKVSEEDFNNACDELMEKAHFLSPTEVFLGIKEILALVDDPHTEIFGYNNYRKYYYPFYFRKTGQDYYLFATTDACKDLLGAKLISIGGKELPEILQKLERIIPAQNTIAVAFNAQEFLNSPLALAYCGVVDGKNERFAVEKDGERFEITPKKLTASEFKQNIIQLEWTPSLAEKRTDENFFYEYFEEDAILYFQYNRCQDNTQPGQPKFFKIQSDLINLLNTKKVKKFVVDLRYNSGGNSIYGTMLSQAIQTINTDADIYVIVGNKTFSSAIINTMDFKNNCNATIIGEPTTSGANHYGELGSFILPNLKLPVYYSTKYFKNSEDDSSFIEPDILIYRTFDDFISGVDTVFEAIKTF